MNLRIASALSRILMPSSAISPDRSLAIVCRAGISLMQGEHHVAQKFRITQRPRIESSANFPPVSVERVKSDAGKGVTAAPCSGAVVVVAQAAQNNKNATRRIRIVTISQVN